MASFEELEKQFNTLRDIAINEGTYILPDKLAAIRVALNKAIANAVETMSSEEVDKLNSLYFRTNAYYKQETKNIEGLSSSSYYRELKAAEIKLTAVEELRAQFQAFLDKKDVYPTYVIPPAELAAIRVAINKATENAVETGGSEEELEKLDFLYSQTNAYYKGEMKKGTRVDSINYYQALQAAENKISIDVPEPTVAEGRVANFEELRDQFQALLNKKDVTPTYVIPPAELAAIRVAINKATENAEGREEELEKLESLYGQTKAYYKEELNKGTRVGSMNYYQALIAEENKINTDVPEPTATATVTDHFDDGSALLAHDEVVNDEVVNDEVAFNEVEMHSDVLNAENHQFHNFFLEVFDHTFKRAYDNAVNDAVSIGKYSPELANKYANEYANEYASEYASAYANAMRDLTSEPNLSYQGASEDASAYAEAFVNARLDNETELDAHLDACKKCNLDLPLTEQLQREETEFRRINRISEPLAVMSPMTSGPVASNLPSVRGEVHAGEYKQRYSDQKTAHDARNMEETSEPDDLLNPLSNRKWP